VKAGRVHARKWRKNRPASDVAVPTFAWILRSGYHDGSRTERALREEGGSRNAPDARRDDQRPSVDAPRMKDNRGAPGEGGRRGARSATLRHPHPRLRASPQHPFVGWPCLAAEGQMMGRGEISIGSPRFLAIADDAFNRQESKTNRLH